MGAIDTIFGRNENGRMSKLFVPPAEGTDKSEPSANVTPNTPPGETALEWHDEKEIQENPDQVNTSVHIGVQKAEAAALVWDKKALYAIYGL